MPRSFSPRASSSRAPRKAPVRKAAPKRVARTLVIPTIDHLATKVEEAFQEGIIEPHHKHKLIHAHVEARHARRVPHHHHWLSMVGVVVSCFVIAFGWWFTVGTQIREKLHFTTGPSLREQVQQEARRLDALSPFPETP